MKIARRETHEIGAWEVTLLYGEDGEVIAAELHSKRTGKHILIARHEKVRVKLPQRVKALLKRHGFEVE